MSKVHRWGMIVAFLVILASGYFAVRTVFMEDKSSVVPRMVGMQQVDAVDALQKEGLLAKVDQVESPLRADTVVSQNVPEGEKIARGKVVVLRVSKGGALLPLPDVRGMKYEEGVGKLDEAGFKVSGVTRVTDKLRAAGTIIAQNPAAPQEVSATTMVSLLVSSGPTDGEDFITVPDLRGQALDIVRDVLEQSGLQVGRVSESASRQALEGSVLSTSPNRGAKVQAGALVNIVLARRPTKEEILAQARAQAQAQSQPTAPVPDEPVRTLVIRETPDSGVPAAASADVQAAGGGGTAIPVAPSAPEKPVVPTKSATLRYQVPPLTRAMSLKVEMTDSTGKKVLRDDQTSGSEYISMNIPYVDQAEVTILMDGRIVWRDKFI